jgi:hypothetical protein
MKTNREIKLRKDALFSLKFKIEHKGRIRFIPSVELKRDVAIFITYPSALINKQKCFPDTIFYRFGSIRKKTYN